MVQPLIPDGVISQGSWTGNHTAIDEAAASDADLAYSQNNPNGSIFEVSLANPAATPGAGDLLISYRHGQVNNGTLNGSGTATALDVTLMQGAAAIASDAQQAPGGAWTTRNWTVPAATAANITDWTDLRLRFVATGGGGSPANRRGVGISWVQAQAQDAAAPPPVAGDGSGVIELAGTGEGKSLAQGDASAPLDLAGDGGGGVVAAAQGAADLAVAGDGAGVVQYPPISGDGSGLLDIDGTASGTAPVAGASSGDIVGDGSGAGSVVITSSGYGDVGIEGSGEADARISADGSGDLDATGTGQASGSLPAVGGDASDTIDLSGGGAAAAAVAGEAGGDIAPEGSGAATGPIAGYGSGDIPISGTGMASGTLTAVQGDGSGSVDLDAGASGQVLAKGGGIGDVAADGTGIGLIPAHSEASTVLDIAGTGVGGTGQAVAHADGDGGIDIQGEAGAAVTVQGAAIDALAIDSQGAVTGIVQGDAVTEVSVTGSAAGGDSVYPINVRVRAVRNRTIKRAVAIRTNMVVEARARRLIVAVRA